MACAWLACFHSSAAGEPPAQDSLQLANGDAIHGKFLAWDKEGVHWLADGSEKPVVIAAATLTEVRFASRQPQGDRPPPANIVELRNGDILPGKVSAVDGTPLTLETPYAGNLSVPRGMVKRIFPGNGGNMVTYEGPKGPEEWNIMKTWANEDIGKNWTVHDGALTAAGWGFAGCEVKLPPRARLEFDLDQKLGDQGTTGVDLNLYCNTKDMPSDSYVIGIETWQMGKLIQLMRHKDGHTKALSDSVQWGKPGQWTMLHFEILADTGTKTFWIFLNGTLLGKWSDPDEFAGSGTGIYFRSSRETNATINHLKAGIWDGVVDAGPHSAQSEPSKEDKLTMANGDNFSGTLKSIAKGKVVFTSSYSDITTPMDRITSLELASSAGATPSTEPDAVRATLAGGGTITAKIEAWSEKGITVTSPDFGKAIFQPGAFTVLRLKPAKP